MFQIHTPLIALTKAQIVEKSLALGVDFAGPRARYEPSANGEACRARGVRRLRLEGFPQHGLVDPITDTALAHASA